MADATPVPTCPRCEVLAKELAVLRAEVRELKARLNQNSSNSNRPPSSDPPGTNRAARRAAESQRKRGGQPGHEKSSRPPQPPDEVKSCVPTACAKCGSALRGADPDPKRHQVSEIPPIKARVVEYELHALRCRCCGHTTRAELDKDVPRGAFGPRLSSLVATLTGCYRISRRNVRDMMESVFGTPMSLGAISNIEHSVSTIVEPYHAQAMAFVRKAKVAHTDETGWTESNKPAWMWTSVTAKATVFVIRPSRASEVAKEILGENFSGTNVSDRYSGYAWIDDSQRQSCWAHLIRDFRKIAESGGAAQTVGECLESHAHRLFTYWHRVRDGTLTRAGFQRQVRRIRPSIHRLLEAGTLCDSKRAASLCRGILDAKETLWTFVTTDGVEPTNNAAERALRTAVIWRKTSYGTQSERGSRFVERMLTCAANLRNHERSLFDFLTEAVSAALRGGQAPVLFR